MVSFDATNGFAAGFKRLADRIAAVASGRRSAQGLLEKYARVKSGLGQKVRTPPYTEETGRVTEILNERFRLEELIAVSEMSDVFRATDLSNGQTVAVKRALDPEAIGVIRHEIAMLGRMQHPNVASLIAVGRDYFVEEFLPGVLLDSLNLTPQEALVAGYDTLDVMSHAHRQNIVIRDLKPENIMVMPDGEIKMFDFGLAKDMRKAADFGRPGEFFCTPEFSPPEVIANGAFYATPASDYFSLGVTLYKCLTRSLPMIREIRVGKRSGKVVYPENGPVLNENNLGRVPPYFRPLLVGLLQMEPARRLADPEQAQQLIIEALAA